MTEFKKVRLEHESDVEVIPIKETVLIPYAEIKSKEKGLLCWTTEQGSFKDISITLDGTFKWSLGEDEEQNIVLVPTCTW